MINQLVERALRAALKTKLPAGQAPPLLHRSDCDSQYASYAY